MYKSQITERINEVVEQIDQQNSTSTSLENLDFENFNAEELKKEQSKKLPLVIAGFLIFSSVIYFFVGNETFKEPDPFADFTSDRLYEIGDSLREVKNYNEAYKYLERADQGDFKVNLSLARCYFMDDRQYQAEKKVNLSLEQDSSAANWRAFFVKGQIEYFSNNDYEEAERLFSKSIELNPDFYVVSYWNRADARGKIEDYKGAVSDWETVIKKDPDNENIATAYFWLGMGYHMTNKKTQGCKTLKKAAKLGSSDAEETLKELNCK